MGDMTYERSVKLASLSDDALDDWDSNVQLIKLFVEDYKTTVNQKNIFGASLIQFIVLRRDERVALRWAIRQLDSITIALLLIKPEMHNSPVNELRETAAVIALRHKGKEHFMQESLRESKVDNETWLKRMCNDHRWLSEPWNNKIRNLAVRRLKMAGQVSNLSKESSRL
ncbi:uncharacterized protein KY384_002306 [Bacidia gigantensis]|uniref:uncharacterized protein n=1 Tax=Bacidia gigantensis TaxID=2732470 RepID=UPI001D0373E1|nr:uncharacterized protein KY384_002306 [Bacidia gigantensis]KAG8533520.1 hypothetical protein KY384_002306 [Bacidia gigantensis]